MSKTSIFVNGSKSEILSIGKHDIILNIPKPLAVSRTNPCS